MNLQDPIGSYLRIRDLYLTYLDTAFRIANREVATERRALLTRPGALCTEPYLEPLPRYKHSKSSLLDLLVEREDDPLRGYSPESRRAFVELVLSGLFDSEEDTDGELRRNPSNPPYQHQIEMLERDIQSGRPGIVTSGTGSGKTESFLLPVFAAISNEAITKWAPPNDGYLESRWWHDPRTGAPVEEWSQFEERPTNRSPSASPVRLHRAGENRPAAVRALVLYPMNALVEDQLVRLRKALDSREARLTMQTEFRIWSGITFYFRLSRRPPGKAVRATSIENT